MSQLLSHLEVLTESELQTPGHAAPHVLAAQALTADTPVLNWMEMWNVLRWYAHNRGYDGNSRWSRQANDDDGGDTEKEKAAITLMQEHGSTSMAETICATLGIDLASDQISSHIPYKTRNAAFPRKIVQAEVLSILKKHKGHLPKLTDDFINTLIAEDESNGKQAWAIIPVPDIQLPRRYFGGLLFGQLIPRFDNRIIATCPISGDKVPNKACLDFLRFRWAMLLANIKSEGQFLSAEQRQSVNSLMEERTLWNWIQPKLLPKRPTIKRTLFIPIGNTSPLPFKAEQSTDGKNAAPLLFNGCLTNAIKKNRMSNHSKMKLKKLGLPIKKNQEARLSRKTTYCANTLHPNPSVVALAIPER